MRMVSLLAIVAGLVAAGCINAPVDANVGVSSAASLDAKWAERAIPYGGNHDHFDPAQHRNLSTPNFELLGHDPLVSDHLGATPDGLFCGEIAQREDGRRIAAVGSMTTDVAFMLADVTDPAKPVKIGEYILPYSTVYDVGVTPDGMHVVVALNDADTKTDEGAASPTALPTGGQFVQPMFRDACTGETRAAGPEQFVAAAPGTLLVDIADPANPVFEDFHPAPILGVHSITSSLVGGKTVVASSITNLAHPISYFQFFTVDETPLGTKLVLQSVYQTPYSTDDETAIVTGHVEALLQKHPITGQELAYIANWDAGMIILDIGDLRMPRELSRWNEYTGGGSYLTGVETGNLHQAMPIEAVWDGRHYTLAGQEILNHPEDHPTGWVYIIDTTDPAAPVEVGRWTLPVDIEWDDSLQFSTHYVEVIGRTGFVATYHGGLWAFDLSTPEKLADPPTIGVFVPDRIPEAAAPGHGAVGAPNVLDMLAWPDGTLTVYEASSGVYNVRFHADDPAPAPPTWLAQQG